MTLKQIKYNHPLSSISSVAQSGPTLCDPMDLPVHHQLPEFTQTHDRWVGDAIQPSHPLSSPSPPVFPMSQFFTSSGQSIGASTSESVLAMNIQDWFPLGLMALISLQSKGQSSLLHHHNLKTTFFCTQLYLLSNSHIHTWLLEKP